MKAIDKLNKLNEDYQNRVLRISHADYLKKYKALVVKVKAERRAETGKLTLSEQIRVFGARVKKEFKGYYIYEGVNFTCKFSEQACETKWWEVDLYENDKNDPKVTATFDDMEGGYNHYERKSDLLSAIFQLDRDYETR